MREKLIELLNKFDAYCVTDLECESCSAKHEKDCWACGRADYLIANGVTFATDNNVGHKWIPVSERLPEENDYYLCCVKSFCHPGRTYINILACDKDGFKEGHIYTDDVTHWMPLPEPPKDASE